MLLAGSPDGNDRPYAIDVDSHGNPVDFVRPKVRSYSCEVLAGMLQNNASFGNLVLDLNRKRSAFASKVDHTAGLPVWVNVQLPAPDGTASAGAPIHSFRFFSGLALPYARGLPHQWT